MGKIKKKPSKKRLSRAERYRRAVALLKKWSEEKSDYDERVWPAIERALNEGGVKFREPNDLTA